MAKVPVGLTLVAIVYRVMKQTLFAEYITIIALSLDNGAICVCIYHPSCFSVDSRTTKEGSK